MFEEPKKNQNQTQSDDTGSAGGVATEDIGEMEDEDTKETDESYMGDVTSEEDTEE